MPKDDRVPFKRLTTAREAAELSQKALADILGVDPVSVNRWEEVMASVFELPDGSVVQLRDGASLSYQPRRFARERQAMLLRDFQRQMEAPGEVPRVAVVVAEKVVPVVIG